MLFRKVFISYNLEHIRFVKDIMSMPFAAYHKLLKDLMLITPEFDVYDALQVFYIAFSNTKSVPSDNARD